MIKQKNQNSTCCFSMLQRAPFTSNTTTVMGMLQENDDFNRSHRIFQLLGCFFVVVFFQLEQMQRWVFTNFLLHSSRNVITSPIMNEIIAICGKTVLRQLSQAADYFSMIADEATDISHNEQIDMHWDAPASQVASLVPRPSITVFPLGGLVTMVCACA